MSENILKFPGRAPTETPTPRLSDADKKKLFEAADSISKVFTPLTKKPVHVSKSSPGQKGLAIGPYNMPIKYTEGKPVHMAGQYIDKLRNLRKFTANSIELRCDALGLAIYVSGVTNIKATKADAVVAAKVRIAVYDFDRVEPTSHIYVGDYKELTNGLVTALVKTYNRLAKQYNLSGLDINQIMLTSKHSDFPDIPLLSSLV